MKKIFPVILLLFFLVISVSNMVFAVNNPNFNTNEIDTPSGLTKVDTAAKTFMATGINVIRTVGVGISIVMLGYIGIKYMMASSNERAEFKKSIAMYVLGAVLIFAASNILGIIADFAQKF